MATKQELQGGLTLTLVISETIRELKEVPEGHIYAAIMNKVDLAGFEKIIGILERAGLISRKNHVVRWIGPTIEGPKEAA